jgi:hypothetical protein
MLQCLGERRDGRRWPIYCILNYDGHDTHRDFTGYGWRDDPNWTGRDEFDEDVSLRCTELGWVPFAGIRPEEGHADVAEMEILSDWLGSRVSIGRQIDWSGAILNKTYWSRRGLPKPVPGKPVVPSIDITSEVRAYYGKPAMRPCMLTCPVCGQTKDGWDDSDAFGALAWHLQATHGRTSEHSAVEAGEALRAVRT